MSDHLDHKIRQLAEKEQLYLPKETRERLERQLEAAALSASRTEGKKKSAKHLSGRLLAVAACAFLCCSLTVTAAVSLVNQRMEALNRERIEEYFKQIYQSRIPADNYNRTLTEEERSRMETLSEAYEEGAFPKGELRFLLTPSDYKGKGIGFYAETSTFFLPEETLTDEELLQLIDFRQKRDYSLQLINEEIAAGNTELLTEAQEAAAAGREPAALMDPAALDEAEIYDPETELTLSYQGTLEIQYLAAGRQCIFLAGPGGVHRMEIGSSQSEPFYEGLAPNQRVTAICQDDEGMVYLGLWEKKSAETYGLSVLVLNEEGQCQRKIDLSNWQKHSGIIRKLLVDPAGNLYIKADGLQEEEALLLVLDTEGNFRTWIRPGTYYSHSMGGLGFGKDGQVYLVVQDQADRDVIGIARVDVENGSLGETYMGIVPKDTIMLDLIAPGTDTDFVFWGYDGIFTYRLGDEAAVNILPAYEAPCDYEGVMYCALPDGRIVFASCTEYRQEQQADGEAAFYAIPESIYFYYISERQSQ